MMRSFEVQIRSRLGLGFLLLLLGCFAASAQQSAGTQEPLPLALIANATDLRDTVRMDFSPDGVRLAVASLDSLTVYDVSNGSVRFRADLSSSVKDVLFDQDGNRLAVALGDDGLVLLDVERAASPEVAHVEGDWWRLARAKGSNAIVGYDQYGADLNPEAVSWSGERTQSLPTERLLRSLVFGNDAEVLAQLQQPALDFHRTTTDGPTWPSGDARPSRAAALYWRSESEDFMLGYFDLVTQQMTFGERLAKENEPRILDFRETSIGPRILLWLRDGDRSNIVLVDPAGVAIPFNVSSDRDTYQRYSAGAISADGSLVALHKRDGSIEVFATADADASAIARLSADAVANAAPALAPKTGHARPIWKVAASPDNALLATIGSGERGLNLWDRHSGYQLRTLAGDETVTAFDFSDDGKTVLVLGQADGIDIRRVADGNLQQTLLHSQTQMAAFIDDRNTILACGTADCTIGTPTDFFDGTAAILERPDRFGWAGFLAGDVSADGSYAGMLMHDGGWLIVDLRNLKMVVPAPIPEAASLAIGAGGRGLVATKDGLLHLIDFETGDTVLRIYAGAGGQVDVAAIGGSRYIVRTPAKRDRLGEWIPAASRILDTSTLLFSDPLPIPPSFGEAPYAGPLAVSPDGEELIFVSHRGAFEQGWAHIDTFDLGRHSWERSITTDGTIAANAVVFAGAGDRLIVNGDQTAVTWDLRTGRATRQRPSKFHSRTISVADYSFYMDEGQELESSPTIFSPQTGTRSAHWSPPFGWDDRFGQAARWNGSQALFYDHGVHTTYVTLFELNEASLESAQIGAHSLELPRTPELSRPDLQLAPDGKSVLSVDSSRLRVFESVAGTLLWELTSEANGAWFEDAAFSEDGSRVYVVKSFGRAMSIDSKDGTELGEMAGGETLLSVSELGAAVPLRVEDTRLSIVNSRSGAADASVGRQGISPRFARHDQQSNLVLIAGYDARNLLWRPGDDSVFTIDAAIAGPDGVAFSPDGDLMALAEEDGTVSLWRTSNGERVARLAAMRNGDWAVVGEDGRYDASNPGDLPSLGWVLPEEPLRVVPLELFFQEYFEPALLPRLLEGEPLGELPEIRDVNRLQPLVKIVSIEQDPAKQDAARVKVEVTEATRGDVRSGVRAVKLFRDDQIVAQVDLPEFNSQSGQQIFEFDGILLPQDRDSVEFSAYAFNADWIKSQTVRSLFELPDPEDASTEQLPTAYVISVGVDKYANAAWDLNYASADARLSSETVSARLRAGGAFGRVVTLELVSAHNQAGDGRYEDRASRAQIEAVLARLGGDELDTQVLAEIAGAEELRPARPGDFVYFFFAGHGLAGRDGQFHLFPSDFGLGSQGREISQDSLQQTLNSDSLARLFRNIQADNMVLVIDACNSAASVEGGGFKPGPMGSRGLGQLAYDKQMRVLTASQTEGVALESAELRHGVLSYAMFREGLDLGVADYQPTDQLVSFGELLRYAETRVPTLHNEIITGNKSETVRAAVSMHADARLQSVGFLQQPALFDFANDSTSRDIEMPILAE